MSCFNINIRYTEEREKTLIEYEIKFKRNGQYLRVDDPDFEMDDLFD